MRPGVARRVLGRGARHRGAALVVDREVTQRLGQGGRVAARDEQPVDAVGDDAAVAGDVRGDDRAAGRERLGQHHPERLAAQRRRDQHVAGRQGGLASTVVDAAERGDASGVDEQRLDLLGGGADDRQLGAHQAAQRLEGAQQHGQPLALDRLPDEHDPQRLARRAPARGGHAAGRERDAVGDDAVVAAEEAAAGPRGGLGHGQAHLEAIELAAGAHERGDLVRGDGLRIAVERGDGGRVGARDGVPADHRGDRLVHVHDVGRERAQLAPQRGHGPRCPGEVGHGAVQRVADRAAQRHQPVRNRTLLWPRAAMQQRGAAPIAVERGEDAHVVAGRHELAGQGLDVPRHTARIRPRIGGHEGDPHAPMLRRGPDRLCAANPP